MVRHESERHLELVQRNRHLRQEDITIKKVALAIVTHTLTPPEENNGHIAMMGIMTPKTMPNERSEAIRTSLGSQLIVSHLKPL